MLTLFHHKIPNRLHLQLEAAHPLRRTTPTSHKRQSESTVSLCRFHTELFIMANQWATDARANPRWSAPEEQEAITTIQRLLLNQISPQQAAETIASTYDSCVKRGQGTSHMWDLWNIVYDAIDKLGNPTGNLDRMVRMMMAISALPDVLDEQGQVVKSTMNEQIFWRELPSFAFYFREVALGKWRGDSPYPSIRSSTPQNIFAFAN